MSMREEDIQRWMQLVVDRKLTLREFAVLGHDQGYTTKQLLNKIVGIRVTMRIPVEKNS